MSFDTDPKDEQTRVDECTAEIKALQYTVAEALEQVRCVQVNLENLGTVVHELKTHPFFKIVKMQLETAVKLLEKE